VNHLLLTSIICVLLAVDCGSAAADDVIVRIGGRSATNAVLDLGCQMGPGVQGNAAKINAHLLTRPAYPLFIPGGYFAITEPIVIPGRDGGIIIEGNGMTTDIGDAAYVDGPGNQPTVIVWEGNDTDPLIQHNGRHVVIRDLALQGRRVLPIAQGGPLGTMARLGIHVRTIAQTGRPTGKLYLQNVSFFEIGTHMLFGQDLDSPIDSIYQQDNADESQWINTAHYHPLGAGVGSGTLAAGSGNTNRVITLATLPDHNYGITVGSPVDVTWQGGTRRNLRVTAVAGAQGETLTLGGGNGDNLPSAQTAVTATEERVSFRFRTQQAVDFTGDRTVVWGNPRDVFWFEAGAKVIQNHLCVIGYGPGRVNNSTINVLHTGPRATLPVYDITLTMDAGCTNVRLLEMDTPVLAGMAVFRGFQSFAMPTGDELPGGGTYAVPLARVRGGMTLRLENFNRIQPGAVQLLGVDRPNERPVVAICHLENCTFTHHFHRKEVVAGEPIDGAAEDVLHPQSTGPYWLTWRDCQCVAFGPYSGPRSRLHRTNWPYEDGEVLKGVTKLPANRQK